jgi:hypothetical protein
LHFGFHSSQQCCEIEFTCHSYRCLHFTAAASSRTRAPAARAALSRA